MRRWTVWPAMGLLLALITVPGVRAEELLLDFCDIGDDTVALYTDHDGEGWGPAEPGTHGGSWGGIASDPDSPDGSCRVVWYHDPDDPDSSNAMVTLDPRPGHLHRIIMRVLDGVADDSFRISVLGRQGRFIEIYSYTSDPSTDEYWVEHTMEMPYTSVRGGKPLRLKIEATGEAWDQFQTYGQLAVDWIELRGF